MKKLTKIIVLIGLIIFYTYIVALDHIPDHIVIFEGENLNVKTMLGLDLGMAEEKKNEEIIQTSVTTGKTTIKQTGTSLLQVSLFDQIPVKQVQVEVLPKTKVIPVGSIAGVKLYTSGVLVVGMSEIEGEDHKKYRPYENSGIQEGDTILEINRFPIHSTEDLIQTVNQSNGQEINIEYRRDEEVLACSIKPVKTDEEEYKLGLWVRDSAAGVGTVTFYEPSTKTFGALGHGIMDIDTSQLINIASGEFVTSKIVNITKGEKGNPGRIQGSIDGQKNIGTIAKNTRFGIYGTVKEVGNLNLDPSKEMDVAMRDEIQTGKAKILCSLDGQGAKEYEIEIEKIFKENNYDNKSMQIKVTDPTLLEKTGGIIQGMSGSPIIQNGKFIGAVTHVLVNNPQEGYAIFGDMMLKQARINE